MREMRCRTVNGYFIPGCMGAAAACGCGKTLCEIKGYCTCPPRRTPAQVRREIEAAERTLAELKDELKNWRNYK